MTRLGQHALALRLGCGAVALLYIGSIALGWRAAASTSGVLADPSLDGRVVILRDTRDVPHIRAQSETDLFFAQGFVEGSDRLFQMELTRRFALGRLAEMLGPKA